MSELLSICESIIEDALGGNIMNRIRQQRAIRMTCLLKAIHKLDLSIDGKKHVIRKDGTPLTIEDRANLEEAYATYMKEAEAEIKLARERHEQAAKQRKAERKAAYDAAAAPIREARRIKLEKKYLLSQKGKP